ncbi:tRNA (5-methylaminomethyl-2-thiouridine)(34)-methyltransferase MnmD [Paludibacter sp.]|uniref:tRNA (5-methylaminomethyl-2-thiouridine)(34)-methyltransferase MnmD n=1 Tax=Paludibacter sp. TaxID=1898105 RepID=UPI001355A00B|nr:tRNA (5-methylaminomethyl-2-thiouridine)(34)-methyltransferase MnmD [Paludibacter sp.]MTK54385.1 tRNA (5-methylaminomethyl-2-thiouridine)(34)-methyltransferase MnmD [Paludibacter sp.]
MQEIQFQLTEDGSHTLYLPEMDEHYHSVHGAVQESRHVFISAGFEACRSQSPRIFEVGFGTGLNALLTAVEAEKSQRRVAYTSVELYPLSLDQAGKLNYGAMLDADSLFAALHDASWNEWSSITPWFDLKKVEADFSVMQLPENEYDLIYFDAFAPNKQEDLWQPEIFDRLFHSLKSGGVFVTYCAKGIVRRMLQASGFLVERLPGPPGKHEMLRGRKA